MIVQIDVDMDVSVTVSHRACPLMYLQVMRCVHEARQITIAAGAQMESTQGTEAATGGEQGDDEALRVKNWLPGSYSRCDKRHGNKV